MKTRTWICLISVIFILCLFLSIRFLVPGSAAGAAEIWSDGKLLRTVDLRIDQSFSVESQWGSNTITVSGGKIAVIDATCPDHYCVQRGYCHSGAQIVCLPNRLVIQFTDGGAVDGAVG